MRRFATLVALGALACLVGGAASAEGASTLSGIVSRVDASGKTFAVKQSEHETTFKLGKDASIMSGSKQESLEALRVGDKVSVTYADEDGSNVASRVQVARAAVKLPMKSKQSTGKPEHSGY